MATIKKMASTAKKSAKIVSLSAMTAIMCADLAITGADAEAAKAAMGDIAREFGTSNAKAQIIHMDPLGDFCA
jgi:hypothetical protein